MPKEDEKKLVRPEKLGTEKELKFALGIVMAEYCYFSDDNLTQCRHDLVELCCGTSVVMSDLFWCKEYVEEGQNRLDEMAEGGRSLRDMLEQSGGDYLTEGVQTGGRVLREFSSANPVAVDAAVEAALDQAEAFNVVH